MATDPPERPIDGDVGIATWRDGRRHIGRRRRRSSTTTTTTLTTSPRAWRCSVPALAGLALVCAAVAPSQCEGSPRFHGLHGESPLRRDDRRLADSLGDVDLNALLQNIGQVDCTENANTIIHSLETANAALVDACMEDSGYRLYPFASKLPDEEQTAKLCASPSCMDLCSGVVLAKLPECEYHGYSPRSLAESFFRVRVDLANGRKAPKASEFGELYKLNRIVNYLNENKTIQGRVKTTFKAPEVASQMNPVEINPDVVIDENYKVFVRTTAGSNSSSSKIPANRRTSVPPRAVNESSTTEDEQRGATRGQGTDGLEDLSTAYVYMGLSWVLVNLLYMWVMGRKGFEND